MSWIPSHQDISAVTEGLVEPWQFRANQIADAMAGEAAESWQLPDDILTPVGTVDAQACSVRRRLIAVFKLIGDASHQDLDADVAVRRDADSAANPAYTRHNDVHSVHDLYR